MCSTCILKLWQIPRSDSVTSYLSRLLNCVKIAFLQVTKQHVLGGMVVFWPFWCGRGDVLFVIWQKRGGIYVQISPGCTHTHIHTNHASRVKQDDWSSIPSIQITSNCVHTSMAPSWSTRMQTPRMRLLVTSQEDPAGRRLLVTSQEGPSKRILVTSQEGSYWGSRRRILGVCQPSLTDCPATDM